MRTPRRYVAAACVMAVAAGAVADVGVPHIFGSNMVLQADAPLPVWGWATPGEKVTVSVGGRSSQTAAGPEGRWKVVLDKMPASDVPVKLTVKGHNEIVLENVLIGEVWVGSGQSNMYWGVGGAGNGAAEVAAARHPKMRLFWVPPRFSPGPWEWPEGQWLECTPETVRDVSAVLYYFGRQVQRELKTPVGLISASWGGTRIEPWIPREALEARTELKEVAAEAKAAREKAAREKAALKKGGFYPRSKGNNHVPTVIYNVVIHPIAPFAIRGAIWYQGESNVLQKDGDLYRVKMQALIEGWRNAWGQGAFPFLFVQLAPHTGYPEGQLPRIWEAQARCLAIPNTGMAVTTDIAGNVDDIHPPNKQDVGKRLALWALAKTYGRTNLVCSGPLYKSMTVEGPRAILTFDHAVGLKSRDGAALTEFQIAGPDRKFVPAQAVIAADKVVVRADGVASPAAVRFGWRNAATPNLSNSAGLPASPFRTDTW